MLNEVKKPQPGPLPSDPGIGRMVGFSLVLHLLVVAIFSGIILPRFQRDLRPVYYVDLVNLPVKDPQAGRPEARPKPPAEARKAEPKPIAPKPEPAKVEPPKPEAVKIPPPPKPEPKPVPKAKPKPQPKPKPADKPATPAPKPEPAKPAASYEDVQSAIEKLQAKKKIEELKQKLAAMAAADTRNSPIADAPVGMPEGRGTEAGVSEQAWIQAFLKQNWSLSKYQVMRQDLESKVLLTYDAGGALIDYRVREKSGDATFDDSVKKAILKEKQLPFKPDRRLEIEVVFNLKDLME